MDELIKRFNININRIRKANEYYKTHQGNEKTDKALQNIVNNCNDICTKLQAKGYDITKLNMDIT